MSPALMELTIKSNMDERPPFRADGLANQLHACSMREPIAFSGVTRDARANNVFPSRSAALVPWDHMIEIEIAPIKNLAAILAGILVALENVVARKLHFLSRHPIEKQEDYDTWDANFQGDGVHHFLARFPGGKIPPALKVMGQEIVFGVSEDDLSMAGAEEGKRTANRADVDRLPETVENENLTIEHASRVA